MAMKKFINDPNALTDELLEGLAVANGDLISLQENHLVVNRKLDSADRVTVVSMGGSGHEPCCAGFVGEGMLDIGVIGDIFAAPGAQPCVTALEQADREAQLLYDRKRKHDPGFHIPSGNPYNRQHSGFQYDLLFQPGI